MRYISMDKNLNWFLFKKKTKIKLCAKSQKMSFWKIDVWKPVSLVIAWTIFQLIDANGDFNRLKYDTEINVRNGRKVRKFPSLRSGDFGRAIILGPKGDLVIKAWWTNWLILKWTHICFLTSFYFTVYILQHRVILHKRYLTSARLYSYIVNKIIKNKLIEVIQTHPWNITLINALNQLKTTPNTITTHYFSIKLVHRLDNESSGNYSFDKLTNHHKIWKCTVQNLENKIKSCID